MIVRRMNRQQLPRPYLVSTRHYSSLFRTSVAKRLGNAKGWSTKQVEEAAAREARRKLVQKVEPLVRERLQQEFPVEFQASWFGDTALLSGRSSPPLTLSSFKTLLALNGFKKVVKPSGNKSRLYLAEGVVATPPMQLSFNAGFIPFASGYQEFARGMDIDNVGVFGDVHNHLVSSTQSNKSTDRLFAQPIHLSHLHPDDELQVSKASGSQQAYTTSFPEFVQEDITLYRILENSAARFLDNTYSRWTRFIQRRFVRPLKDAKYRTRVAIKSANAMRANVHQILEKSIAERLLEQISQELSKIHNRLERHSANPPDTTNIVVASVSSGSTDKVTITPSNTIQSSDKSDKGSDKQEKSQMVAAKEKQETSQKETVAPVEPPSDTKNDNAIMEEEKDDDPLETLVVVSSRPGPMDIESETKNRAEDSEFIDSVALYRRMTPSTRILALPDYYVLRHSSASSLVSVSLVVFGALPLAYRSYIFSIDYDWLVGSGTIATSVIATITYGIVSWRWRARTSQSKTLHEALGARVGARDEAALLLLKEGAIRSVVEQILQAKQNHPGDSKLGSGNAAATTLIDPLEWANDFGILDEPTASKAKDAAKEQAQSKN